ncbi:helix-turn-helix domain-containing protein [Gordonia hydrophobica]|uniref:Helix-turn-helix transcriptional regulator n=1 Tax=Gordonia hydrophobica TaxID=40516 RepID=A0ABZ2TZS7_9ACTN|nr:helix-turn-helix transcriptional regulator [Gordonia hydrophobica]MBM7369291.1 transcriptional regulator with XRE-family HTH domain [Gordonia hydrophobica]
MPAKSPQVSDRTQRALSALGTALRTRRKELGVTAAMTAESAGMSRVTLHRVESGSASVTVGAYANAAAALGMQLTFGDRTPDGPAADAPGPARAVPGNVRVGDYPQLRAICWQLGQGAELSREEALHRYERGWRHVDQDAMTDRERTFIQGLADEYGGGLLLV